MKLIALTHQLLQLSHHNRPALEAALGLNTSEIRMDASYREEVEEAMVHFWLPKTLEFPDHFQWYTHWEIVLKSGNFSIGGIGFAGYPNAQGEAEIGYMIGQQHQNQGYATEALKTLMHWAFTHQNLSSIIVQTYADNAASRKILLKNGFTLEEENDTLLKFRLSRIR